MAFIRLKKIKGNKYAYIVENTWKKGRVKQHVKKYIGRVHKFSRQRFGSEEEELEDFLKFVDNSLEEYLAKNDAKTIMLDTVRWELKNHGFVVIDDEWRKDNLIFSEKKTAVLGNKTDAAFAFNEGMLNTFMLKKLLRFEYKGNEEEIGYKMAKDFVELGIKVPKQIFIGLYEKILA